MSRSSISKVFGIFTLGAIEPLSSTLYAMIVLVTLLVIPRREGFVARFPFVLQIRRETTEKEHYFQEQWPCRKCSTHKCLGVSILEVSAAHEGIFALSRAWLVVLRQHRVRGWRGQRLPSCHSLNPNRREQRNTAAGNLARNVSPYR